MWARRRRLTGKKLLCLGWWLCKLSLLGWLTKGSLARLSNEWTLAWRWHERASGHILLRKAAGHRLTSKGLLKLWLLLTNGRLLLESLLGRKTGLWLLTSDRCTGESDWLLLLLLTDRRLLLRVGDRDDGEKCKNG